MSMKRTFISFDAENDESLRDALRGQSRMDDSPFSIADWSVKEPFDNNWKQQVRDKIKQTELMVVICGEHTDKATGVSVEIDIARQERIPYFLLQGYSDKKCVKPKTAVNETMYTWNWDNLKKLIDGQR